MLYYAGHMSLSKAIDHVGTASSLAGRLGVTRQAVLGWVKGERPIPEAKCRAIEILTEGAVTCESLRPDVDWRRWRDVEAARDAPIDTQKAAA